MNKIRFVLSLALIGLAVALLPLRAFARDDSSTATSPGRERIQITYWCDVTGPSNDVGGVLELAKCGENGEYKFLPGCSNGAEIVAASFEKHGLYLQLTMRDHPHLEGVATIDQLSLNAIQFGGLTFKSASTQILGSNIGMMVQNGSHFTLMTQGTLAAPIGQHSSGVCNLTVEGL